MTLPLFPTFIGVAFPVKRTQQWNAVKQDALSGKRIRVSLYTYPTYDYELVFNVLRTTINNEWQLLSDFISILGGPTNLFSYNDPNDDAVKLQPFGTGDGVSTYFQLVRTLYSGGFPEPVYILNGTPGIYENGVAKTPTVDYNISDTGNVSFKTAPGNGVALTWTGNYYWPCRFDNDGADFSNIFKNTFELKSLKFSTEKIDTETVAPPT